MEIFRLFRSASLLHTYVKEWWPYKFKYGENMSHISQWGWGSLTLTRIMMVSLIWWFIKFVQRLDRVVAIPHKYSSGNLIKCTILGKSTRYSYKILLGGDAGAVTLLHILCWNFILLSRYPDAKTFSHYKHWTRFWLRAWYDWTFPVIRHLYEASEILPEIWQVWKIITAVFFTFVFNPSHLNIPVSTLHEHLSHSVWVHYIKP